MPCQCAPTIPATTVPGYSTGVPSYSTGVGTEYVVPGSTIQTVPMTQGSGTIYGGQLPLDGQFGMTVVGDRIVGPSGIGKVTAPVKVGQK